MNARSRKAPPYSLRGLLYALERIKLPQKLELGASPVVGGKPFWLGIVKLAHRAKRVPKMKAVLALAMGAAALAPSQPKVSSEKRVA